MVTQWENAPRRKRGSHLETHKPIGNLLMIGTCPVDETVWNILWTLTCLFDVAVCEYTFVFFKLKILSQEMR